MIESPSDLIGRLALRDDGAVLAIEADDPRRVAVSLVELHADLDLPCVDLHSALSDIVAGLLRAPKSEPVVIAVDDADAASLWRLLDEGRSELARSGHLLFVATPAALATLSNDAPHLASWFEEIVVGMTPDADLLTPDEIEARLAAWRASFGWSDAEMITRAERGEAPADPGIAEWLTLLGRRDLLVPR
jgi:hypothetical protein